MLREKKIKRGFLAGAILIVLTLSFAQVTFFEPATKRKLFRIADQEDLPARGNPAMAYDNESDLIVIFGGWNNTVDGGIAETWTYDFNNDPPYDAGNPYINKNPTIQPLGRAEPGFVYDTIRDQIILFGGEDDVDTPGQLNDTWIYNVDTNTWSELFPAIAPSERRAHNMAFDTESDRAIIFGGIPDYDNDTWAYDPGANTWSKMSPANAPDGRAAYGMAYDSESDRVILFGGYDGGSIFSESSYRSDTWAYNYNTDTWEQLITTGNPSARGVPSMAYDSESDRIVLFGGAMSTESYSDTWLFDYNTLTWEEMSPAESPSARGRHGSAYDWESDLVIIYGGTSNGFNGQSQVTGAEDEGKTWAYDVNTNTWERKNQGFVPGPTTPTTTPPPVDILQLILVAGGAIAVVVILLVVFVKRR